MRIGLLICHLGQPLFGFKLELLLVGCIQPVVALLRKRRCPARCTRDSRIRRISRVTRISSRNLTRSAEISAACSVLAPTADVSFVSSGRHGLPTHEFQNPLDCSNLFIAADRHTSVSESGTWPLSSAAMSRSMSARISSCILRRGSLPARSLVKTQQHCFRVAEFNGNADVICWHWLLSSSPTLSWTTWPHRGEVLPQRCRRYVGAPRGPLSALIAVARAVCDDLLEGARSHFSICLLDILTTVEKFHVMTLRLSPKGVTSFLDPDPLVTRLTRSPRALDRTLQQWKPTERRRSWTQRIRLSGVYGSIREARVFLSER